MPSYPYEPGCESRTDSLLTPGMDNTRHFYSYTSRTTVGSGFEMWTSRSRWSNASCEPYIRLSYGSGCKVITQDADNFDEDGNDFANRLTTLASSV